MMKVSPLPSPALGDTEVIHRVEEEADEKRETFWRQERNRTCGSDPGRGSKCILVFSLRKWKEVLIFTNEDARFKRGRKPAWNHKGFGWVILSQGPFSCRSPTQTGPACSSGILRLRHLTPDPSPTFKMAINEEQWL